MKYLKMLVILFLTIFTVGVAAAQVVVKARVGQPVHRHYHRHWHHRWHRHY